jgi:cytochrome c
MMKRVLFALVAAAVVSAPAFADMELAKKSNCLACHAVDTKLVGPAYKEVAAKYAGQKDAVATLTDHILKGSTGRWGAIPMPANTQVSEGDAKKLAAWVLSLK